MEKIKEKHKNKAKQIIKLHTVDGKFLSPLIIRQYTSILCDYVQDQLVAGEKYPRFKYPPIIHIRRRFKLSNACTPIDMFITLCLVYKQADPTNFEKITPKTYTLFNQLTN